VTFVLVPFGPRFSLAPLRFPFPILVSLSLVFLFFFAPILYWFFQPPTGRQPPRNTGFFFFFLGVGPTTLKTFVCSSPRLFSLLWSPVQTPPSFSSEFIPFPLFLDTLFRAIPHRTKFFVGDNFPSTAISSPGRRHGSRPPPPCHWVPLLFPPLPFHNPLSVLPTYLSRWLHLPVRRFLASCSPVFPYLPASLAQTNSLPSAGPSPPSRRILFPAFLPCSSCSTAPFDDVPFPLRPKDFLCRFFSFLSVSVTQRGPCFFGTNLEHLPANFCCSSCFFRLLVLVRPPFFWTGT